jgi:hypothetical protein
VAAPFIGGSTGQASLPSTPAVAAAAAPQGMKYVQTFEDTPGYSTPGTGESTGTLRAGRNYIHCKVEGPEVRRGDNWNRYWLKTDLDTGTPWKNQYVSAFAMAKQGNNQALAEDGSEIPDCTPGGAGEDEPPVSDSAHTLNVQWEQQSKGYNCGPTTVRMLLGLHGVQPSIADISATAGTTGDGTYRTGVAAALNQYQDAHEYEVKDVDGVAEQNLRMALLDDVKKAVGKQGHGIALTFDGKMPGYRSYVQHWVAIVGIDGDRVLIADPTSGAGTGADMAPTYWVPINELPIKTWVS